MRIWTPEQRAKAAATRAENKRKKEERLLKKAARDKKMEEDSLDDHRQDHVGNGEEKHPPVSIPAVLSSTEVGEFDWEDAPLVECINKAAQMKREYERVAAIIVKRQNPANHAWTCWTELRKNDPAYVIPKSVRQQCLRRGEDGKWKFRDDGNFVMRNGVRTLEPVCCCNSFCYSVYQSYRVRQKVMAGV
jgi:hypothetical protein